VSVATFSVLSDYSFISISLSQLAYAKACHRRGHVEMQLWPLAHCPRRYTGKPNPRGIASREYYGPCADEKHHVVWDVHDSVQSRSGRGDGRCFGHADARAVRAGASCALGAWISDDGDR